MSKKVDEISGNLVRDDDQSVVIMRPKHYIGSTGSVWATDYVKIRQESP